MSCLAGVRQNMWRSKTCSVYRRFLSRATASQPSGKQSYDKLSVEADNANASEKTEGELCRTSDGGPRLGHSLVLSSVVAGTPLKGIKYLKNENDPIAMEDWEYPDWLWKILQSKRSMDECASTQSTDIHTLSQKDKNEVQEQIRMGLRQRRRDKIKEQNFLKAMGSKK